MSRTNETLPAIEVVHLYEQPWMTADDHAVARQIVSPSNSRAQKLSIADIIVPPGVEIRKHRHAVIEETYYVTAGKGTMWINGAVSEVVAGDAVVILPGETHSIHNASAEDLRLVVTCVPPWSPDCLIFDP
jgi:mannose-6-phosphate isomerase-like protein (cupin superfamily)